MSKREQTALAWCVVIAWIGFGLVSLKTGWLNPFFFDTDHVAHNGIDFFSVARAWVNLLSHRSMYDSFRVPYGPFATFYNYHPLLAVVVGMPLTWLSPHHAYATWTLISLALLWSAGWIIGKRCENPLYRAAAVLLLAGSFPGLILLQSGNVQSLLVLAVSLVICGLERLRDAPADRQGKVFLLSGLLLSLFSKPILLAVLPLLLLVKRTRITAASSLAVYLPVSFLSLCLPAWNPVSLTWAERGQWLTHPAAIAANMNVYTNQFRVTPPMMDNAVHWFAMVGLTDFRWLHIDIYSLSAFLDGALRRHTAEALYRVPLLLVLEVSALAALVRDARTQMEVTLRIVLASSLLLILSYGVVWEYHYTLALPVAAFLLKVGARTWTDRAVIVCGVLTWLPSLYVFLGRRDALTPVAETVLHGERAIPVLLMFGLLISSAVVLSLRSPSGLRWPLASKESHS